MMMLYLVPMNIPDMCKMSQWWYLVILKAAKSDQENQCQPKKILWRPKQLIDYFTNAWKNFIIYEGLEDYSGSQGEAVATLLTLPNIWGHSANMKNHLTEVFIPSNIKGM